MRCSLKQKQSIKRKCPASDRENIASNVRANHIGEDDLLTLFRHVSALGETNVTTPNEIVFEHACKLGCEGIVSKRLGSPYRSGRSPHWLKVKNPEAPAVKREAEEKWG
jgi:ATP-dependent DNA ligase